MSSYPFPLPPPLQSQPRRLGLARALEDRAHLHREAHIPLDLEPSLHEGLLRVQFARGELEEVRLGDGDDEVGVLRESVG